MPRFTIRYQWVDNNGKRAQVQQTTGPDVSFDGAVSLALGLAPLMQALSDAALVAFTITQRTTVPSPPAPGPQSDYRRYALFFYRDGDVCASVRVPSPTLLLAETSGLYAGQRITRERLEVLTLLPSVEALPQGALDPVGRPYGGTFIVGGIVNL